MSRHELDRRWLSGSTAVLASKRRSRSAIRQLIARRQKEASGQFIPPPNANEGPGVNYTDIRDCEADDDGGDPFDETPFDGDAGQYGRVVDTSEPTTKGKKAKQRQQHGRVVDVEDKSGAAELDSGHDISAAAERRRLEELVASLEQEEEDHQQEGTRASKPAYTYGEFDELRVHGTEIPSRYRDMFWETEAEETRRKRSSRLSFEEAEAERQYRRQEAMLMRTNEVGRRGWLRDVGEEKTRRQLRVGAMVERAVEEISYLLAPVKDVWVGRVEMAPSMRKAVVYWHCTDGREHLADKRQKEIEKLVPNIRRTLATRVSLKYVPELVFVHDANKKAERIEKTQRAVEKIEKSLRQGRLLS